MRFIYFTLIIVMFYQCKQENSTWQTNTTDKGLPYRSFYPEAYKKGETLPLLLFLHGAGERGDDNESQLVHIAPLLSSDSLQNINPCILIFPQCPEDDYWAHVNRGGGQWTVESSESPTPAMQEVMSILDKVLDDPQVDKTRLYISGLSMGGFGTFDLLSRKPTLFAAAVPICGGADTTKVDQYAHVPLWNFHGAIDPVVPVELSQDFISNFIEVGGNPRYTEYHDGEHNIWDRAYKEPQLLTWLFKQKK